MTRRPLRPPGARDAGARRRMAPGGRMWSESPVVFPRERVAGAGTPADPTYVAFGTLNTDTGALTWTAARESGDRLLAAAVSNGGTPVPPPGWTTIDTGTAGAAQWVVAAGISAGGAQNTIEGTWTLPGTGGSAAVAYCVRGGSAVHVESKDTGTGGSHAFLPVGTMLWPLQTILAQDTGGTSITGHYVDPTEYWQYASLGSHPGGLGIVSTFGEGVGDPDGPFPGPTNYITPDNTCDYAALVWGVT